MKKKKYLFISIVIFVFGILWNTVSCCALNLNTQDKLDLSEHTPYWHKGIGWSSNMFEIKCLDCDRALTLGCAFRNSDGFYYAFGYKTGPDDEYSSNNAYYHYVFNKELQCLGSEKCEPYEYQDFNDEGHYAICKCHLMLNKEDEYTPHTYKVTEILPSCELEGYTLYTCKFCGYQYKENYLKEKGHSWDKGKVVRKATYEEDGLTIYACTVCGKTKDVITRKLSELSEGSKFSTKDKLVFRVTNRNDRTVSVYKCSSNSSFVSIPKTVKYKDIVYKVIAIDKNAFKDMKSLKEIVIGQNITTIGKKAFYGCKNLKKVVFNKKVTTLQLLKIIAELLNKPFQSI